jgi:Zn-dependent peptidase ImmA (M78 family)
MNIVERIAKQRNIPLDALTRVSGLSRSKLTPTFDPDNLKAKELERLAGSLGVEEAALFSNFQPQLPALPQDFRTAKNSEFALNKYSLNAIYRVFSIVEYIKSIKGVLRPNASASEYLLSLKATNDEETIRSLQAIFSFNSSRLLHLNDPFKVFNLMRLNLEQKGIIVVCERLRDRSMKGFCLNKDDVPVIFLNIEGQSYRSRIFTLAHEAVHLIWGQPGISDPFSDRLGVERDINRIVSRFLVDDSSLKDAIVSTLPAKDLINDLYDKIPLSKFFLAIRVQELGDQWIGFANRWLDEVGIRPARLSNNDQYNAYLNALTEEDENSEESSEDEFTPRHTWASYQVARLGFSILGLVEASTANRITTKFDNQHFLRMPAKQYEKVISSFRRKVAEVSKYASE